MVITRYKTRLFFFIPLLIFFFFIIKFFEEKDLEKRRLNVYSDNIELIQKFFLGQFSDIDSKIEPIIKRGDSIKKILSDF